MISSQPHMAPMVHPGLIFLLNGPGFDDSPEEGPEEELDQAVEEPSKDTDQESEHTIDLLRKDLEGETDTEVDEQTLRRIHELVNFDEHTADTNGGFGNHFPGSVRTIKLTSETKSNIDRVLQSGASRRSSRKRPRDVEAKPKTSSTADSEDSDGSTSSKRSDSAYVLASEYSSDNEDHTNGNGETRAQKPTAPLFSRIFGR